MLRRIAVIAAALALLAIPRGASGLGQFDIKPVVIDFAPGQTATSIEVTNSGSTAQELQITVDAWQQRDGRDELTPSDDIIVSPSIFVVQPGKTQLLRAGPARAFDGTAERSYRLVATEIPSAGSGGVSAVLRVRLPMFIAPQKRAVLPLVWHSVRIDAKHIEVSAKNDGNVHQRVRALRVEGAGRSLFDEVVGEYVLAGQTHHWTIPLETASSAQPLRIVATAMDGSTQQTAQSVR